MITVQAEAYCEELIKIAAKDKKDDVEVTRVAVTPQGVPFPERPGPTYTRRFFGDALAVALGASAGAGLGHIGMQALKKRPGWQKLHPGVKAVLAGLGPALAGAGSLALARGAEDIRKRRLVEAIYKDKDRAKAKREKEQQQ